MAQDRKRTKKALSDDAKIAQIRTDIKNLKLQDNIVDKMLEKYGIYAYDLIHGALYPSQLANKLGIKFNYTAPMIMSFVNGDVELTDTQLAKLHNENELQVQNKRTQYKANQSATNSSNQEATAKKEASERQEKLDKKVNTHKKTTDGLTSQQLRDMKSWKRTAKISDKDFNTLIEKYGPLAYDIMQECMNRPSTVITRINASSAIAKADNKTLGLSARTIKHFIVNDFNEETLAKAVNKSKDYIKSKTSPKQKTDDTSNTKTETSQNEARDSTNNNSTTSLGTDTPPVSSGNMTLDDYVDHYDEKDKPLSGKALEDAAWQDFGKGEGISNRIYVEWQNHGNPTIGKGNLIIADDLCQKNPTKAAIAHHGTVEGAKERFRKLKLTNANGKALSDKEKDKIFEDLRTAVRNKTLKTQNINGINVVIEPKSAANVRMNMSSMRERFNTDFEINLKKAKADFPQLDKYPLNLQLAVIHAYFAGHAGNIKNTIKGTLNPKKYSAKTRSRLAKYQNLDKNNPRLVSEFILDIRSLTACATYDKMQLKEGVRDTLNIAERNYYAERTKYNKEQRKIALGNNRENQNT